MNNLPHAYTPEEVAAYLNVTVKYVRELARRGEITHSRVGYRYWFREEDVAAFLADKRISA